MQAWLQHKGGENGPFFTERVEVKEKALWWQERGLLYTATGYGRKIPTRYMVQSGGKWRRVYCCIFSNSGTLYIGKLSGEAVTVQIEN
jgi:hypothetical protein